MRRPDFLIIGAMKAGTTTLYRDLVDHPAIFLPEEKEPNTLVKYGDDMQRIIDDYASLFARAPEVAICGEASTAYTKRPDNEGVAARARRLCGEGLRLIYLMRDPTARLVSHYKHDAGLGMQDKEFAEAVREDRRYIDYSRYEWQLEPWIEAFGESAVLRLSFEDYVANRHSNALKVCEFLGVDPALLPAPDADRVFNASDGKPVAASAFTQAILRSRLYQRRIKGLLPKQLRDFLRGLLPVKAEPIRVEVDSETRDFIVQQLASDP